MLLNNESLKQSLATYSHIFDKASDKNHIAFKTKATVITRTLGIIFAVLALGASVQSLSFTFYAWAAAVLYVYRYYCLVPVYYLFLKPLTRGVTTVFQYSV